MDSQSIQDSLSRKAEVYQELYLLKFLWHLINAYWQVIKSEKILHKNLYEKLSVKHCFLHSMSPMKILLVEYLQAHLARNYKNIKPEILRPSQGISRVPATSARIVFYHQKKTAFLNMAYKDHSFLLKFPRKRWCIKERPCFSLPNI